MQVLKQMLLTPGRGGRPSREIVPKAVVIHWTANTGAGADAVANRNYFEGHPENKVSAHYIVDDHQVVQCLPEDEMGYHVGAYHYQPRALELLSSYPNNCTIGIETCVNRDGNFTQTYQNLIILTADILHRHGWDVDRLWRHYDITGKDCPRFFVADEAAQAYGFEGAAAGWERFKRDVNLELKALEVVAVFRDIVGHWAQVNVEHLAQIGIVAGKGDGTFSPDTPITRAETAVIVDRAIAYVLAEVQKMLKGAA